MAAEGLQEALGVGYRGSKGPPNPRSASGPAGFCMKWDMVSCHPWGPEQARGSPDFRSPPLSGCLALRMLRTKNSRSPQPGPPASKASRTF